MSRNEQAIRRLRQKLARMEKERPSTGAPHSASTPVSRPAPDPHSPRTAETVTPEPITYRRDRPVVHAAAAVATSRANAPDPSPDDVQALDVCVDGDECCVGTGRCFLVEQEVGEGGLSDDGLGARLQAAVEALRAGGEALDERLSWTAIDAGKLCFLDLETAGLSCAPVFLIGILTVDDGRAVCRQFLARTYAEERTIIEAFTGRVSGACERYVTYNGKSFDLPFLTARATVTGARMPPLRDHLDLIYAARRRYRDTYPDCRLQTLEHRLCGRLRTDDVPGSQIPQAYHEFVRTGDARVMARVLKHNLLDLATLAELLVLFSGAEGRA